MCQVFSGYIWDEYKIIRAGYRQILYAVDKNKHQSLSISLPVTECERQKMADEWHQRSGAFGIYFGMLGAIDGWLCTIEKPNDVPNPSEYFSGHYQKFGFNVQAICDANLRFIHFAVAGKGSTNDARAFRKMTVLRQWLENLKELGFFLIGDNAYPLMNTLLIPFSGVEAHDYWKDIYNFYLSQLRIRIEMTFGRLTTKWRIFRTDLPANNGSEKNTRIIRVGAKLHNYVINLDQLNFLSVPDVDFDSIDVEP